MKKSAIITIAGMSSRFSKSVGYEVHKAIFSDDDFAWSTLSHQLNLLKNAVDEIIIVTGYKHCDIEAYLKDRSINVPYKLVFNEHYFDYGSGYSLILGIEAVNNSSDEIIFLEGDLIFDKNNFNFVVNSSKNVITTNNTLIDARKSVVFYVNENKKIKYLYDTNHNILKIHEPFLLLGNSGQVWKFNDIKRLKMVISKYGIKEYKGTNLIPINDYFCKTKYDDVDFISFEKWFNCNTLEDYNKMKEYVKEEIKNG